ncbi:MAG: CinA family protein, partial [Chloroflexi bacterium]|nr:CinA family protein [Chloroflexota bacterium]
RQHGAVSQETATAMARTIAHNLGADFGIGITGVAGPLEEEGKPVGLMYVAITGPAGEKELQLRVPPRRITIKRRISNTALIELNRMVNELDQAPD